jgi:Asp-tRNA(Asn)/Glu-tRNA(Gln) amidotransferase A subunit family amidase
MRPLRLIPLLLTTAVLAQTPQTPFNVVGATIANTQQAIREGRTTCRAVVEAYLHRIALYDQTPIDGLRLNSIVLVNPHALD